MIGLIFPVIIWIDIQGTKQVAASSVVMGFGIYMLVVQFWLFERSAGREGSTPDDKHGDSKEHDTAGKPTDNLNR